jgi:hypothetical protein
MTALIKSPDSSGLDPQSIAPDSKARIPGSRIESGMTGIRSRS